MNALGRYLRQRAGSLELTLTEISRRSGVSRQTLNSIGRDDGRLPEIDTCVRIAQALRVHPLRLLHLAFEGYKLPPLAERDHPQRGDRSAFLADLTYPDGEVVAPGARFTKVWELQNVGSVPWTGRFLQCMDDEIVVSTLDGETLRITERLRPAVARVPIPPTIPGATVQLQVDFVAPALAGTCVSYWKAVFADGSLCFPKSLGLTCKVRVTTLGAATPDAEVDSQRPANESQAEPQGRGSTRPLRRVP